MDNRVAAILDRLEKEKPIDPDLDSVDEREPELLPDVEERAQMERGEAKSLLDAWRSAPETAKIACTLSLEAVLESAGAVRAHLERLLRDSGHAEPAARIERQPGHEPYLEIQGPAQLAPRPFGSLARR